jgi:hypothetical protein
MQWRGDPGAPFTMSDSWPDQQHRHPPDEQRAEILAVLHSSRFRD